jgi:hypothetical protein
MTAFNDYVTAGLRVFDEWRPRLQERLGRRSHTFPGGGENEVQAQISGDPASADETGLPPISLPVPLRNTTLSGPYLSLISLSLFSTMSNASSQEILSHLPSPRFPTLFRGCVMRWG